ncbi:methionine import ATP-binding protein MetN 1 [Collibacillus ludicampi]|uniref:Methionine import ATP-binding protein MetN 1 n=1 Tax=Collibacillus ludicampi TaxID=2771369 RepID=A0AAV4LC41_9BACL|nr:methionine ABC transporter ATP-binding protein [Collibacillus ludicampi]GIM45353.1 methionine import ATP-binding protein MetN 1 [Collibacillus ludicampi]
MIQLSNVSKTFYTKKGKVDALKNVSLQVNKGEIFGVIGYSGAGKSTLIRCVNLLERPTGGRVTVNGVELTALNSGKLKEMRKKIGMIFQGFNLLKTATVYDNIAIPFRLAGVPKSEIHKRVEKYLAIVGLQDRHDSYPSQLSGGQKQRVAIARALALEPEVLLSDEATSALDPETTETILDLLLKINDVLGITILLITHEMNVVQRICDRVAVMENGEIVETGSLSQIFTAPKHETTKKFVNSLFHQPLPKSLVNELKSSGPIVTLSFTDTSSGEPALALVSKKFDVYPNILSGNVIQLKNEPYGKLIVHLQGNAEETKKAVQFLEQRGVRVEGVNVHDFKNQRIS